MALCTRCCEPMSRVSVWLPKALISKARNLAPSRRLSNLGCILADALWDYVEKRESEAFDREIRRMAKDEQFLKALSAPYPRHLKRRR